MKIAIGADHAGYLLKEILIGYLNSLDYEVIDYGTNSEKSVDYPDIIHPLANDVNNGKFEKAIIICGSGIGVSLVANRYPNVRAALCWNEDVVKLCRQHNNANILALPARFITDLQAITFVDLFLSTEFESGRHQNRIDKINK